MKIPGSELLQRPEEGEVPTRTASIRMRESTWAFLERSPDPPMALALCACQEMFVQGMREDELEMILGDEGYIRSAGDAWRSALVTRSKKEGKWPESVKVTYPVPGTRTRFGWEKKGGN